tara:strand:- start:12259 stop:12630 length:372 start_codon:yes stop_codon:yes gene_type:complete
MFDIRSYSDDPDVLAKAEFVYQDQKYDVLIVTAQTTALTHDHALPEVVDLESDDDVHRLLVVLNSERLNADLEQAVQKAQDDLDEAEDTTNYAAHIGTAGASIISMWISRSLEAAKAYVRSNG